MRYLRPTNFMRRFTHTVKRNAPTILLVSGLTSGALSLYFTVKGTIKAVREVDASEEELAGMEILKKVWKHYVPAVISAGGSAACFIGMHSIHNNRMAALMTAYKATEASLLQYQSKVTEVLGEKKEKEIQDAVVKEHITSNPPTRNNIYIIDIDGEIIYDEPNKRYYQIRLEKVYQAFMTINKELLVECVKLNRYYELIGLPEMDIGDVYCWESTADGIEVTPAGCPNAAADIGKPAFELKFWPPYGVDPDLVWHFQ